MMADNDRPYEELGRLLERWRRARHRSASAMHRDLSPSFSYKTYAELEKGAQLPSVAQLLELAGLLKQDAGPALLLWAEVQVPREFRALFRREQAAEPAPAAPAPGFENTWVFGRPELEFLRREPWFWEFCQSLIRVYPKPLAFAKLGLLKPAHARNFVERYLRAWLDAGRMSLADRDAGVRLTEPHIHLPRTAAWSEIRARNFERALAAVGSAATPELVTAKKAYREIVSSPLSPTQLARWVEELSRLAVAFAASPNEPQVEGEEDGRSLQSLILLLGPRTLEIPREVIASCKVTI